MKNKSTFFKISFIYFISLVLFVLVRIAFQLGFLSGINDKLQDILSTSIIQIVIMLILPFLFYKLFFKKKTKQVFVDTGFKKISGKAVFICILIGIIAFIFNIVVSSVFNGIIGMFGFESSVGSSGGDYSLLNFFINVLTVAVLPAFCEEFMHRGILMRGLFNSISVKNALIISSICFGLMHLNIVQVFYAAILGCLIGFVSIVGKSIWPAIIIHFVNNFVNVYLSFAKANNWIFGDFYDVLNNFISNNWLFALIIIILVLTSLLILLIKLIMDLLKITSYESFKNVLINIKNSFNKNNNNENTYELKESNYINDIEPILIENLPAPKSTTDLFLQDIYNKEKLIFKDKIFMIATIFLGVFITIATFIWGII